MGSSETKWKQRLARLVLESDTVDTNWVNDAIELGSLLSFVSHHINEKLAATDREYLALIRICEKRTETSDYQLHVVSQLLEFVRAMLCFCEPYMAKALMEDQGPMQVAQTLNLVMEHGEVFDAETCEDKSKDINYYCTQVLLMHFFKPVYEEFFRAIVRMGRFHVSYASLLKGDRNFCPEDSSLAAKINHVENAVLREYFYNNKLEAYPADQALELLNGIPLWKVFPALSRHLVQLARRINEFISNEKPAYKPSGVKSREVFQSANVELGMMDLTCSVFFILNAFIHLGCPKGDPSDTCKLATCTSPAHVKFSIITRSMDMGSYDRNEDCGNIFWLAGLGDGFFCRFARFKFAPLAALDELGSWTEFAEELYEHVEIFQHSHWKYLDSTTSFLDILKKLGKMVPVVMKMVATRLKWTEKFAEKYYDALSDTDPSKILYEISTVMDNGLHAYFSHAVSVQFPASDLVFEYPALVRRRYDRFGAYLYSHLVETVDEDAALIFEGLESKLTVDHMDDLDDVVADPALKDWFADVKDFYCNRSFVMDTFTVAFGKLVEKFTDPRVVQGLHCLQSICVQEWMFDRFKKDDPLSVYKFWHAFDPVAEALYQLGYASTSTETPKTAALKMMLGSPFGKRI